MTPLSVPPRVDVYEVGPRDGLQSVKATMPTAAKLRWIDALVAAGVSARPWRLALTAGVLEAGGRAVSAARIKIADAARHVSQSPKPTTATAIASATSIT